MRFGPDVEWIEQENYDVDPRRADVFYASIRRYWPGLPDGALVPDYAGIRPKLTGPEEPAADFMIDTPAQHGVPRLVNLFGIESPGLTSALSLAEDVSRASATDRSGAALLPEPGPPASLLAGAGRPPARAWPAHVHRCAWSRAAARS